MTTSNDREQIIREAKYLFSKDVFEELKEWYRYTLQGNWQYVVFAVRRSYMMALIMEVITEKEMCSHLSEFLTDAALFLRCEEMANEYRMHKRFPRLLFCDDILIFGRNINHIIEGLQSELLRILGDGYSEDEIKSALVEAVQIHVYVRASDSLLLGSYTWKLHYMRKEGPAFWHQLASNMASLILRSNLTNACYIYTEYLSDAQMGTIRNWLEKDGFVHTTYQNTEQYARFFYLNSSVRRTKMVLSLRIIKNAYHQGYRVAPFVFLPNLNADETTVLFDRFLVQVPSKYRKQFLEWKNIGGMRSFNEMMTLLLSDAVLKSFNEAYGITIDPEDKEKELIKLARNYDRTGFEQTKQMLDDLLGKGYLLRMEEVASIVGEVISDEHIMMEFAEDDGAGLTNDMKQKIKERVEDFFYERGRIEEVSAFELMRLPYFQTKLRSRRRAYSCDVTLMNLNKNLTMRESRYCLAYFLQMIDAGIGGLTSYAPDDSAVKGYEQFTKAGELSLLITPLRLYEYIPMLSRMQTECERRLRILTDEVREFGGWKGWTQEFIDELVDFVNMLGKMGHTPRDWNGNYIEKIDKGEQNVFELIERQDTLRRDYISYAYEKYKYR